ncbi:MAG: ComEC family competence protein [Chloroflexi bacterium ADurb.Bin325]|nr:MAG: ComEC family competence protein [Chloroflexi bacterium ADurb.Bin325]
MSTQLHMIGVKAGDATLIEHTDGNRVYYVLIDGGLDKQTVHDYLRGCNICHLDLVIASHLDYDHLGGLLAVFKDPAIKIDEFWTFDIGILTAFLESGTIPTKSPDNHNRVLYVMALITGHDLQETCRKRGILFRQVTAGHVTRLGGLLFEVLYPSEPFLDHLYDPATLKKMLRDSRIPLDWKIGTHKYSPDEVRIEGKRSRHQRLSFPPENPKRSTAVRKLVAELRPKYRELTESDDAALKAMSQYWDSSEEEDPATRWWDIQEDDKLGPQEICTDRTIFNDISTVFRVSSVGRTGFRSALFTGDLENWTSLILTDGHRLRSELLKIPHHGSRGVGWNPEAAYRFCIYRYNKWLEERHQRPLGDWPLGCLMSAFLWHEWYKFTPWCANGNLCDILELVRPQQALIFPFPRFRLPSVEVVNELKNRKITVFSNRVIGAVDLSSAAPQTQVIPFDP